MPNVLTGDDRTGVVHMDALNAAKGPSSADVALSGSAIRNLGVAAGKGPCFERRGECAQAERRRFLAGCQLGSPTAVTFFIIAGAAAEAEHLRVRGALDLETTMPLYECNGVSVS